MHVTLFSTCKPFEGLIGTIQWNAFQNWAILDRVRVIIFGNGGSIKEAAKWFGFTYVSNVECGPQNYPLIPAMFEAAQRIHPAPAYLFTNADMIYWGVESALNRLIVEFPEFLMIGLRQDVKVTEELLLDENWVTDLRKRGKYHPPCGVDFFGFTPNLWPHIPRFQVGCVGFDNWLVRHALRQGRVVVDVTAVVDAFHQSHPTRTSGRRPGDLHNVGFLKEDKARHQGWVTHANWTLTDVLRKKI